MIRPDCPETFNYFMHEFEDKNLHINVQTLINILESISLSDEDKIKYLTPYSMKKDIVKFFEDRSQNLNITTNVSFDVFKLFTLPNKTTHQIEYVSSSHKVSVKQEKKDLSSAQNQDLPEYDKVLTLYDAELWYNVLYSKMAGPMVYPYECYKKLGNYLKCISMARPSPETDLVRIEYQTGRYLNNKQTGKLLELAVHSKIQNGTSFLNSNIAEISIQYYWD